MRIIRLTIRKKIILSFVIIIALSASILFVSYDSINNLRSLSLDVIPLSREIGILYEQIEAVDSLESKVESYLTMQSEESKDEVLADIDSIITSAETLDMSSEFGTQDELSSLKENIENLIDSVEGHVSSYAMNQQILNVYSMTEEIKSQGRLLLIEKTKDLNAIVNEQNAIMINLNSQLFIIGLSIILFGGFLSIFLSTLITSALSKLSKFAKDVSKGNLDAKIVVESGDEIGELASSFSQMTKDLKRSRKEIRLHANELEGEVQRRTKEMDKRVDELTETKTAVLNMMEDMDEANKELVQTHGELEDTLRELKQMDVKKDQFISIAAHELKTPLTSIHGFSQLLMNRKVADNFTKRSKYLKIMEHETKRLAKLVNDILDLSRIDLGTVKLGLVDLDAVELMRDIESEMSIPITDKGLKSKFIVDKALPKITTDREKLTEVLINIIGNAVKYTIKGGITVKVSKEKDVLHFVVMDTGVGIARDNHGKIFDRFYQVDSSYTRKVGGTGLGLSLSKEFVELLGGKIWVKSEPDKGSEFHFTIPIKSAPKESIGEGERRAEEGIKKTEEMEQRLKKIGIVK